MSKDISPIEPADSNSAKVQRQQQMSEALEAIAQEAAEVSFEEWVDTGAFNLALLTRRFENLEEKRKKTREQQAERAERKEDAVKNHLHRLFN